MSRSAQAECARDSEHLLPVEVARRAADPAVSRNTGIWKHPWIGVPAAFADLLADTSLAISDGDWHTDSTDLKLWSSGRAALSAVVAAAYARR